MLFLSFALLLVIGCSQANSPISAEPDKDETRKVPKDLTDTDLTNLFCEMKDKECFGTSLQEPKFAPTIRQCLARCANLVGNSSVCLSAFFTKDKLCYLRGNRCTVAELRDYVSATDLYRLKKGESCTIDRPSYVGPTVKYTNNFCMVSGKKCPGQNLYDKSQNIAPYLECLKKCAKLKSCGCVDFFDNKCEPKELRCREEDLVDDETYTHYIRLIQGEETCTAGSTQPSDENEKPSPKQTPEQPKPVEVPVPPKPTFCRREWFTCRGNDVQFIPFVFSFERCMDYCASSDDCKSIFWGFDGSCWLKGIFCDNGKLSPWYFGHDAVKLSTADCSQYEPKYDYCDRRYKTCPYHDINIVFLTPSMERCQYYCNYNPSCKSVTREPFLGTCWLKDYRCSASELRYSFGTDSVKKVDGATC